MALKETEKTAIRRHLKYGSLGLRKDNVGGGTLSVGLGPWFFENWTELEIRMDSLSPIEEAQLNGLPYGLVSLQGPDPAAEASLTLQFTGSLFNAPENVTFTSAAAMSRIEFGLSVARTCAENVNLNSAGIQSVMPYGTVSGVANQLSEIQFVAQTPFNIAVTAFTGIGAYVFANGSVFPDVQSLINEVTIYGYIPICNKLYSLIGSSSDLMSVDKADVFTARKSERKERKAIYIEHVKDMADFLVNKMNPMSSSNRSNLCSL